MNNVFIILVKPQLGQNIGSVARVMKNLNFKNLRIVNPRDGWPNQDVISTAAGADDVITNTKVFDNVSEACNDLNYLLFFPIPVPPFYRPFRLTSWQHPKNIAHLFVPTEAVVE